MGEDGTSTAIDIMFWFGKTGLPGKAGVSLGMEHVKSPRLPNYYNFAIKGFPGKDLQIGITVPY